MTATTSLLKPHFYICHWLLAHAREERPSKAYSNLIYVDFTLELLDSLKPETGCGIAQLGQCLQILIDERSIRLTETDAGVIKIQILRKFLSFIQVKKKENFQGNSKKGGPRRES